jgi:hypothetical protein
MTAAVLDDHWAVIRRAECPHCHEPQGARCWSAFLQRPMENQVHSERRTLAAASMVQPKGSGER